MFDPLHDLFNSDHEDESGEESTEDEEEEEETGGRVALAFDPTQLSGCVGLPQNGHDHLKLVQSERLQYPAVISSPKPTSKDEPVTNQRNKSNSDQDDLVYCDEILNNFKRLRERVEAIRQGAEIASAPVQYRLETSLEDYEEEETDCNPRVSSDEQQETMIQLINMDESDKRVNNLLKLMELGHPPQASSLLNKSQLELHKTLEAMADHCEMTPNYCTIHTDWIYSLMASLREPIEPDICSTLRRLARLCIAKRDAYREKKRMDDDVSATAGIPTEVEEEGNEFMGGEKKSNNNKRREAKKLRKKWIRSRNRNNGAENNEELVRELEEEEYTSSLLIICIVRHYFGQSDLK